MSVVDASVVVSMLAGGQYNDWAEEQLSTIGSSRSLWAPHLIDAEVGHSLRRRVAARKLGDDLAEDALRRLPGLPLRRIVHTGLLERAWQLRHNISFYDGLYVALAERLQSPLLTLDGRLAGGAAAVSPVEVLTPS